MPTGRFAPSPTGRLHLGNLRTALVAWLASRVDGSAFLFRFEDLGPRKLEHYQSQIEDLEALGLDFDGEPIRQLDRLDLYRDAIADLKQLGVLYECFCSRSEVREAAAAPNHAFAGHGYPGTCRDLSAAQRQEKIDAGRPPALRLRANSTEVAYVDAVAGEQSFVVDDFVVQRNDGVPAYHLVVVVDDAEQGVGLVVRGDDLLGSTSRHLLLYRTLALQPPSHLHIPLVLAADGERLAKRHGAVDLDDQARVGRSPTQVRSYLASTLGLCSPGDEPSTRELLARFDVAELPREPLMLPETVLTADSRQTGEPSE